MSELQELSRTIQLLQLRIRRISTEQINVDRLRANCQMQINKLRNIQAGLRNQASPGAQKLRVDITMWEHALRRANTQFRNLRQSLEVALIQKRNAEARLDQLREVRRRQMAAMEARGWPRGRGGRMRY